MASIYAAHIKETTNEIQTVKEHCENTAVKGSTFSVPLLRDIAYDTGLLHDIGKYQVDFQKKISGENLSVEHSVCGAIEARRLWQGAAGWMMAYCIAGHHSGLPDGGTRHDTEDMVTLQGRLKRRPQVYSVYREEMQLREIDEKSFAESLLDKQEADPRKRTEQVVDRFAFLTRYLFSCLTDADSLDTAAFCSDYKEGTWKADFRAALEKVKARQKEFRCQTPLQKSRGAIQKQAYENAGQSAEIYLMNMPTGSGKTLCSVRIALEKAVQEGKKRIIYVIPYNSIIDQTSDTFEAIFGETIDILRHQSTFSYEDASDKDEDYRENAKNAVENWNAPFIITTAVQFFESVYADKRGKLRKLHNMADSILVFDEAHLMPQRYLQPCLQAIAFIARYLNSEALLLTATMPDYERMIREYALPDSKIADLITDKQLFPMFVKCRYHFMGKSAPEELLADAQESASALIVVNSKRSAQELYRMCSGRSFHLSTYMTAYDRRKRIAEIKAELAALERDFPKLQDVPEERRITVVSTSLIEAGVDLDFQAVYREISGLDNILQAGGRCNREGKRTDAVVNVFELERERKTIRSDEKGNLTLGLFRKYEDISLPECIREYYDRLYFMRSDEIQEYAIHNQCMDLDIRSIPFRTYAEQFQMIDSHTVSLVVPRDEVSLGLIEELQRTGIGKVRKLRNYACTIQQGELDDLIKQHAVSDFGTGIWCLTNPDYYGENLGVRFEACDYIL